MNKEFFMDNKKIIILGVVILLLLISNFTTSWSTRSQSKSLGNTNMTIEDNVGLWNDCLYENTKGEQSSSSIQCTSIDSKDVKISLTITRACIILSLLLMITGITLFYIKPEFTFNYVLFISAGILSIIGSISWNSFVKDNGYNFGYSWYFNLLAGMAAIGSGVMIQQNKL